MIRAIAATQEVGLLVHSAAIRAEAMEMLDRAGVSLTQVQFLEVKTNRGWLRDCGPIWVRDAREQLVALDWKFNGWAKYGNHRLDTNVPAAIADFTKH
jgi:agmatine deiminase